MFPTLVYAVLVNKRVIIDQLREHEIETVVDTSVLDTYARVSAYTANYLTALLALKSNAPITFKAHPLYWADVFVCCTGACAFTHDDITKIGDKHLAAQKENESQFLVGLASLGIKESPTWHLFISKQ